MRGDEIMGLLVCLSLFALIFGIFYIRNRENMALIERGINPRETPRKALPKPFTSLKYGLLILGAGVGLICAFFIDYNIHHPMMPHGENQYPEDYPQIYFALIAIGGGLGLVISYLIEKKWYDRIGDRREEE
jgi:hypothetical protein